MISFPWETSWQAWLYEPCRWKWKLSLLLYVTNSVLGQNTNQFTWSQQDKCYLLICLNFLDYKMNKIHYELEANYPSFSFFCLHFIAEKKEYHRGLQKKKKQRVIHTGKSISCTSKISADNWSSMHYLWFLFLCENDSLFSIIALFSFRVVQIIMFWVEKQEFYFTLTVWNIWNSFPIFHYQWCNLSIADHFFTAAMNTFDSSSKCYCAHYTYSHPSHRGNDLLITLKEMPMLTFLLLSPLMNSLAHHYCYLFVLPCEKCCE